MASTSPKDNTPPLGNVQPASLDTARQGITSPTKLDAVSNSAAPSAEESAIKDRIDNAFAKGPKKADQSTGGRVMVAEQGDLNELAARRQST